MKKTKQKLLKDARRIVVKIGSHVLTKDKGILDEKRISSIARQISLITNNHKKDVVLVSSGAVAAGMGKLNIYERPDNLPEIQALASIGQTILIEKYRQKFNRIGFEIGQILVTREDFRSRKRYLNISNTLSALIKKKIIPIVNENDTVITDEITFGDNDQLAALISQTFNADILIILSNMDGFLDIHNNNQTIPLIEKVDSTILNKIENTKSIRGAGGMHSKVKSITQVTDSGIPVILANGKRKNVLYDVLEGNESGTLFMPSAKLKNKKRWIAYSSEVSGSITIDNGALKPILNHSSLLPSGIIKVTGNFKKGAAVELKNKSKVIAKGLVNYSADQIRKIKGLKSSAIKTMLGNAASYQEVIHRDNLVPLTEK